MFFLWATWNDDRDFTWVNAASESDPSGHIVTAPSAVSVRSSCSNPHNPTWEYSWWISFPTWRLVNTEGPQNHTWAGHSSCYRKPSGFGESETSVFHFLVTFCFHFWWAELSKLFVGLILNSSWLIPLVPETGRSWETHGDHIHFRRHWNDGFTSIYIWLVVWNMTFIFPYIGNFIIPTDNHICQRGRSTTNKIYSFISHLQPWIYSAHLCGHKDSDLYITNISTSHGWLYIPFVVMYVSVDITSIYLHQFYLRWYHTYITNGYVMLCLSPYVTHMGFISPINGNSRILKWRYCTI